MSQTNGHYLSVMEIACLPVNDPLRVQLHKKSQAAGGADHVRLELELALTDRLRAALTDVQPAGGNEALLGRLLAIAEDAKSRPQPAAPRGRFLRVAAAVLLSLGLVGAATYYYWPDTPSGAVAEQLSPGVGKAIVDAAIRNHESGKPLEISSSDADAVTKALAAHGMDFPVLVLKSNPSVKLEGGGTCQIGAAQAAYTRWAGNGMRYTLYEFNAADAGAPPDFIAKSELPRELWHDDKQYHVILWPGAAGKCCWALVLEKPDAGNPFQLVNYGTAS